MESTASERDPLDPRSLVRHHLRVIRRALPSDRAVARILGVDPAQVSRWRRGQAPDAANADRLAALSVVVELLARWLHPDSVEAWIGGRNAHLDDRSPAHLIRHGHLAAVIAAIEAEKAGAYA